MIIVKKSDGEKRCDSCIRKVADYEVRYGKAYTSPLTGEVEPNPCISISVCRDCAESLIDSLKRSFSEPLNMKDDRNGAARRR